MSEVRLDETLRLLADARRRRTIEHLRLNGGELQFVDLIDFLSAGQSTVVHDMEGLVIEMRHTHLPKLDDHGVIEYDEQKDRLLYRRDRLVERVLDTVSRSRPATNP